MGAMTGVASPGTLFVVATPIGNLGDLSARAVETLKRSALIAAEDTRHTLRLLDHFGIHRRLLSLHEHNELARVEAIVDCLSRGEHVALVSDAGTPAISDPGQRLVAAIRERGFPVAPIPGACALIAALSASGIRCDRFAFEGFLPAKPRQRQACLSELALEPRTLVFYEAPHRILESLEDLVAVLGADRRVVVARELTKSFETFLCGEAVEVLAMIRRDANQQRGEFVLVVQGAEPSENPQAEEVLLSVKQLLTALAEVLPTGQAATVASRLTGLPRKLLYDRLLALRT